MTEPVMPSEEVKRFYLQETQAGACMVSVTADDGDWVRAEDYDRVHQQLLDERRWLSEGVAGIAKAIPASLEATQKESDRLRSELSEARRELARARAKALGHASETYWWISMDDDQDEHRQKQCRRAITLLDHYARKFERESEVSDGK